MRRDGRGSLRDWDAAPGARLAVAAVVLAGLLALWTLARALRVDAAPAGAVATAAIRPPAPVAPPPPVRVRDVVARDPFSPDRAPPPARYRLPGEVEEAPADDERAARRSPPRLLGTVVATGGGRSFAICQVGRGQPVMLHVGERLGDFTVAEITRGRVVFTTPGGERVVVENP
ncbi:MAG TPA: hypothetical protein VFS08_04390 [Gemmatimonadaceae bacterium]|nr:hypothetical protein [Gemmatimonadaceae bacterium]